MEITAGTITRTIILALALINQMLSATGHPVIPIQDADVETLVSTCFTVVMAVIAWWKNNSFTKEAIAADKIMHAVKTDNKNSK